MGAGLLKWRNLVSVLSMAALAVSLKAQDTGAAILHGTGVVLVNKYPATATTTLFPGDRIETQTGVIARIELAGSAADINPETVIQFEGDELILEHGSLSVNTSRGLEVRAGCVTVTPVRLELTHYEVSDLDGRVQVSAIKDDVFIESRSDKAQPAKQPARSDREVVRQGEQKSREEKCGGATLHHAPAAADGTGPILNSPYVVGTGVGVIGVVACWALCRGDEPISPAHP